MVPTIEQLLEQHGVYQISHGLSIEKRDSGWMVYYKGKHVDCWGAEYKIRTTLSGRLYGTMPKSEDLTFYATVMDAVCAAVSVIATAKWLEK